MPVAQFKNLRTTWVFNFISKRSLVNKYVNRRCVEAVVLFGVVKNKSQKVSVFLPNVLCSTTANLCLYISITICFFFFYLRSNFETEFINNNFKTKLKNDSAHSIPLSFFECVHNNKKIACNRFPHFQLLSKIEGDKKGGSWTWN